MAAPAAAAPPAFPPWQTVYGYFRAFLAAGVWENVRHHLVVVLREGACRPSPTSLRGIACGDGREASPSAAVVGTQSVKTTEEGGHAAGTRPSA